MDIKTLKKLLVAIVVVFAVCALLMTLVYCIPSEWVKPNAEKALEQLETEKETHGDTDWPMMPFPWYASELDGYTDEIMLSLNVLDESDNPFIASLMSGGRSHHWHGYQLVLRPLLLAFDYFEIRYINYIVIFGLLFAVCAAAAKKINLWFSAFVLAGFVKMFGMTVPASLQFVNTFVIAFAAMLIILLRPKEKDTRENNCLLFLLSGAAVAFFDFLTTPALAVGLPLLALLALRAENAREKPKKLLLEAFTYSAVWAISYAIILASKWLLSELFLSRAEFAGAFSNASGLMGDSGLWFGYGKMFLYNIYNLLEPMKVTLPIIVAIIVVRLVLFVKYRSKGIQTAYIPTLLFVSAYPYLWYAAFMTHSGMHFWFTYRSQYITVVGVLYAMYLSVDWQKLQQARETRAQSKRGKIAARQ